MIKQFFINYNHIFSESSLNLNENSIFLEHSIDEKLLAFCQTEKVESLLIVADQNTWKAAGKKIKSILSETSIISREFIYPETEGILIPDEISVNRLMEKSKNSDLFIAVGSGTINDLVRHVAFICGKKYISIPTAPSVDGFASSVSPLIIDGVKKTMNEKAASAIFADIPVLSQAPRRMISAGIGDLIGKFSAILDWRLSAIYTEEKINTSIILMVEENINKYFKQFQGKMFIPEACSALLWNLIITGLAISAYGTSRPASGSEHHISHLLETQAIQNRAKHFLHGETVGLGSWIILNIYNFIFSKSIPEIMKFSSNNKMDRAAILESSFGDIAPNFINQWNNNKKQRKKIKSIALNSPEIWDMHRESFQFEPSFQSNLIELFGNAGISTRLEHYSYTKTQIVNVIISAKEIRSRFTILEFIDSLGCLENIAEHIVQQIF